MTPLNWPHGERVLLPRIGHDDVAAMKVLVVEDDPTLQQALLRLLTQWGCAANLIETVYGFGYRLNPTTAA